MISKFNLFSDLFEDERRHNVTAVVYNEESYTYRELRQAIELCASDLVTLGVKSGDHVGLWGYNSINWIVVMMAIVRVGGVAVLANYNMTADYAAPLLDFSDIKFLAYGLNRDTNQNHQAGEQLANMVGIPGKTYCYTDMNFKARLLKGERPMRLPEENPDPNRDAIIIFTTGTTAMPKAVLLSQKCILNNAWGSGAHIDEALSKFDSGCVALPLFHSFGLNIMVCLLQTGKTVYLISRLKPEEIINVIARNHISALASVGILNLGMISSPRFKGEVAPYLRLCVVGGEFANPQQIIRMHKAYPDIAFIVGFGQTESGPVISMNKPSDAIENRAYTVGTPIKGTKIRIVDINNGQILEDGKIGEVQLQSDSMMNGYYKIPPEKQAIGADGWLRTGDLGYFDENKRLRLTGRLKDIIIKNGENISPREIENGLLKCEGVEHACVMGAPSPISGEEIEACITMMEGFRFDENAIRTQLMKYIIKFKIPEHFFVYDTFPLNENGKVNVLELRKSMLERMKG